MDGGAPPPPPPVPPPPPPAGKRPAGPPEDTSRPSKQAATKGDPAAAASSGRFVEKRKVGEGTYGRVYRARDASGSLVALKELILRDNDWGFPLTSIR